MEYPNLAKSELVHKNLYLKFSPVFLKVDILKKLAT